MTLELRAEAYWLASFAYRRAPQNFTQHSVLALWMVALTIDGTSLGERAATLLREIDSDGTS